MDALNLTRRRFLEGAALASAALASTAALAGCSSSSLSKTGEGEGGANAGNQGPQPRTTSLQSQVNPQDYDYTSNTMELATLFSPFKLGKLEIANRIVKSAAGSSCPSDDALVEYYRSLAHGGVKLIWVENFGSITKRYEVGGYPPVSLDTVRRIAEAVHAEGSYVGYQWDTMDLLIGKHDTVDEENFTQAVATDLAPEDIVGLHEDVAEAVKGLQAAGIDAFEINAAGNNLGQAFLSRMRNQREDEYGPQNFESRARFITELIQTIKGECGADFPIQVLINIIEENDATLGDDALMTSLEENKEFAKLFEAAGADSLHLRLGPLAMHVCQFASDLYFAGYGIDGITGFGTQFDFSRHWGGKLIGNHSGCGMTLDAVKEIKEVVSIPVGAVTYMDPAHAPDFFETALRDGKVDFLLMNRPLNVDHAYVNKLQEGKIDEIAPCTRCLHCHHDADKYGNSSRACRVNACTSRAFGPDMPEGYELPPKTADKSVMIVGGGPAGMEAARVAALRGYDVTLYEKKGSLGGLLDFAHMVKGPHENLDTLKSYLEKQIELCGIKVVPNQTVDVQFIKNENPDVVILATGGLRPETSIQSTDGTKVISINDFLAQDCGSAVTILGGNAQAVDCALYLHAQGKQIDMVLPGTSDTLGMGHSIWVKTFVLPMLYASGVRVWTESAVAEVNDGSLVIENSLGLTSSIPCECVIDASDMIANNEIPTDIAGCEVYAVGDCDDPFNIAHAISSANLVARTI